MEKRVFKSNFLKGAVCAALAALLCAALLTCSNAAGGSDAPSSQQSVSSSSRKPGYVTLTGTVSVSGAVPKILADTPDASDNDASRSAHPRIDVSGETATMEYFATATCGSDVVNGTFGSGAEAKKFGLELAASKTWSIVVGVRSKTAGDDGKKKVYLESPAWTVTPDPADPMISHNFVPVPNTSGGEGKIELNVNCSVSSSSSLRVKFISGPDGVDLSAISAVVTDNTSSTGKIIKVENVHSGVYELCLDFLTSGNMLEYSSLQTVTVADGMTTNSWVDDANASALSPISGGEFKFNNDNKRDLTAAFLGTTVFVGKVSSDSAEPDDSNSGNFLSPLKTITRAAERINAVGNGGLDYYIRVSGEVSGLSSKSAAVIQTLAAEKAKSLTIIGTSGPDTDCIKSVTYQHSALNVTTPVPIKLKNIKIVGATGEDQGDAVSAWGSANVIIEDSVVITGADIGVEVSGSASVTMKGGTIAGNGVAVDMKAGSFVVQGGSIPYDSANKKNYVKTASEKFVTAKGDLAAVDASGGKIAIEPAQKKRGVKLIDASAATASDTDIEAKFMVYDPTISAENPSGDEWQLVSAAADRALKINAPIYVGQTPEGYAGNNDNPGTKSLPYFSIERACQDMDDADMPYTINVRGNLRAQTIPSALSKSSSGEYKAKSVLIKGVNPIPTSGENAGIPLDQIQVGVGVLSSVTSGLTVESTVPITIQNLKITGGEHANGGGLYLNSGTEVHLESGVLITDNTAKNHGGGVYCAGGKLYIKEGAKICGNHVSPSSGNYGGIGLYATGSSVIEMTGGEISGNKDTSHVDVVGGGVKLEGSASFKMSGGEVKDNQVVRAGGNFYVTGGGDSGPSVTLSGSAKITGGLADSSSTSYDALGGAVWLEGAGSSLEMSGGEISGNKAKSSDGKNACAGIYVSGATFTMSGGKISGNNVLGGNIQGGAVRLNGKFNISGSACIPYGGEIGKNDVYLCDGKTVTIAAALNPPEGVTKVAAITPSVFKRGTNILDGTAVLLSQHKEKFSVSQDDADWDKVGENIAGQFFVRINSPVYVVGAEGTGSTKPEGFGWGQTTGATGTKGHPFASVSAALSVLEAGAINEITIAGLLKGAQTISGTFPSFTLKGYGGSSLAVINAGGASGAGSALTVDASGKTVTIQDLTITGGNAENGGGINLAAGTVNLESGAKVYSNKATSGGSGAGVYVASDATLNIKTGSEIYSNAAYSGTINGGGVYNGGTTTTSGGQIYNNSANNGGGVYNGGSLYVTGTSLIGDGTANNNTATGANPGSNCSNLANYGGGIYNNGNLYFGCDSNGSSSTTGYALSTNYGVRRNNATQGGGIYLAGGTFKAASGTVSYNHAAYGGAIYVSGGTNNLGAVTLASNNVSNSGGALYLANSTSLTVSGTADFNANSVEITSGSNNPRGGAVYNSGTLEITASATFKNNVAKVTGDGTGSAYGGAIYNGGTLTMTAGTIGATSNLNSVSNTVSGSASKAYGGAIYQGGTFNVSGSAKVLPGTERSNDVYLPSGKVVTINGNYNGAGNTASSQMALTPANWTRGSYVLGGASCNTTNAGYFKITDSEWEILKNNSTDKGRIDADIYVAPTSSTTTVNSVTYGKGAAATAGGQGTKAKPYSTIADAVAQCWGGPKDTGTGVSRVINIVGTITGPQEIASTVTTSKASGITLKGVNTSATLNGNMSSTSATKKSTLTISTAVPVTIQTLTVKGGYSSGNGGGILVNGVKGASLTLGADAVITGNTATTNGGGIYFAGTNASGGTANLIMNSTSQISGNTANGTASTNGGGGVYLSYANLSMSGSALIGDTSGTTYATSGSTGHSNMAKNGGGVYLAAGGKLRLGYASAGATGGTSLSSTYGIRHNYASACGGGVYAVGSVDFAYGAVSCNGTAATSDCDGGGIWFGSASTLTMTGGTIANNKGCYGGGVYAGGTLSMSGGTIGDSSKTTAATSSSGYYSNSASYGGGIYAPNGSTLTLNGGYVSYNYASTSGGGIYSVSSNAVTFKANANFNRAGSNGGGMYIKNQISMTGGVIKGNCAVSNGGGVYMDGGNLYMSGSAVIGDSSKSDYAASASACSNYALNNGGGVYLGDESYAYLGYTNSTNPINSFTGGIYYNYAKYNGGGICDNPYYGNDVKYNGGSISYNGTSSSGFGGAVYLTGNSSTLTFSGSNTKIVAGSYSYYNTVYLNGAKVGVVGNNLPTSATVASIIPSSYSETTQVMGSDSAAVSSSQFTVLPNSSNTWSISPSTGKLQKTNVMTNTSLASFSPTAGTKYNFVIPADVEQNNLSKFLDKLFNHNDTPSMGAGSSMDFSKVTSSINFDSAIVGGGSDRRTNNITTIIVPGGSGDIWFHYSTDKALTSVTEYVAPADSENYTSVDGVLYNKDMTELIKYPAAKLNTAFTIPDSVRTVSRSAFYGAIYLQQISIPTSVTRLGESAFYGAGLISVTIPGNEDVLDGGAIFQNCSDLTSVTINSGVKYIGTELQAEVFKDCKKLKTVSIPSSVIRIGRYSFENCFSYSSSYSGSITVPSGVTFLGRGVFSGCTYLSLSFSCPTSGWKYGDGPNSGDSVSSSYFTTNTFVNGSYKLVRN